ncbi:fip1 motif family protein [Musa troglodytarum]|uniref:Fip1 motif family protein n=1 Tax=Musa troglodytarum TaxID=320322 RepID=A0A9E7FST4_9LILI|nr:fip1 motif family protein [Musa troglodytarum]
MEDDDEFGELYTDVFRPIAASSPAPPRASPDRLVPAADDDIEGGDEDEILFGASRSSPAAELSSVPHQALAPPAAATAAAATAAEDYGERDWMLGRAPPVVEAPENWHDKDDSAVSRPTEVGAPYVPDKGEPRVLEDDEEEARVSEIPNGDGKIGDRERLRAPNGHGYPLFGGGVVENLGDLDEAQVIPGLSAEPAPSGPLVGMNIEERKPSQSEDWDSDSEDDLRSDHGPLGVERNGRIGIDDDDGEEDLVIVTDEDQHHHLPTTEEENWGEEAMQSTGDGERKEMVDVAKISSATGSASEARIGYNTHGSHPQHHSMYKYIRPGAAPLPGGPAAGTACPPGAARPPLISGPVSGGGRGDWRPAGGRGIPNGPKGYTGFGFPAWANSSSRAFGSGLDFTLPAHKCSRGVAGDEIHHRSYHVMCEVTSGRIIASSWQRQPCKARFVSMSGRSEQEYDPDLPPELATAAGHHNISANNGHRKADDGEVDFSNQGRGSSVMRAPLPTGRAIQVEGGYGERLPSIDTRPPRIRDADAVIEDSFDDPKNATVEKHKSVERDDDKCFHEVENDDRNTVSGNMRHFSHASGNRNKQMTRRAPSAKEKDEVLLFPSESSAEYHQDSRTRSPVSPAKAMGIHQSSRLPQGSSHRRSSNAREQSIDGIPSPSVHSNRLGDEEETQVDSAGVDRSSGKSSSVADDTVKELSVDEQCCGHDEKLTPVSTENEGEDMVSDVHIPNETSGNDKLVQTGKKQKLSSLVEQPAGHDSGHEDELRTSNSDNSRQKSGSSKDYPKQTENGDKVIQEEHSSQVSHLKRPHKEECYLRPKDDYGLDARQVMKKAYIVSKGKSYEKKKESESSISSWQRREDNVHSRRVKDEDRRWENSDEMVSKHRSKLRVTDRNQKEEDHSKKRVEDREWRGHNRDDILRQRSRDDLVSRHESIDEPLIKKKRDEEYLRGKADKLSTLHGFRDEENFGRKKRARDDGIDHRRREVDTRMRDKADDHLSSNHKDDNWHYREREDRQRLKPHESAPMHREREEGQVSVRSGRAMEDKALGGSARNRDESKTVVHDSTVHQEKERRQHNDHSRRDHGREDDVQNKGCRHLSVREKHSNADRRNSRHERLNTHKDCPPSADGQPMYRERHKENTRKSKDSEAHEQHSQGLGKRKHEDHHTAQTEKVYIKSLNEQESNNISSTDLSKDPHQIYEEPEAPQQRKQEEADPASDEENQGSRKGRSKLERWTSHKERDYDATGNTHTLSASSGAKKIEGDNVDVVQADEVAKTEFNNDGELDGKDADGGQIVDKMVDEPDHHLDTMAKLKRRSERFKLPMPIVKETTLSKKLENEVQSSNNEAAFDSEVKPERPARKRRWTGSS